jgi:hypothetical protein
MKHYKNYKNYTSPTIVMYKELKNTSIKKNKKSD